MNGTIFQRRHSLNMIRRPTRSLPSWNGWMNSNRSWKSRMSTKVFISIAGLSSSSKRTYFSTCPGSVVAFPPTSLGSILYSPRANHSLRLSLVPCFNRAQLFDEWLTKGEIGTVDHLVDIAEVIHCLHDIVYIQWCVLKTYGVCLIDMTDLFVSKLASSMWLELNVRSTWILW